MLRPDRDDFEGDDFDADESDRQTIRWVGWGLLIACLAILAWKIAT